MIAALRREVATARALLSANKGHRYPAIALTRIFVWAGSKVLR